MNLSRVSCLLFFAWTMAGLATAESYTVQKGDSLTALASRWKLPAESVSLLFPDINWDKPPVGTKLTLPERHAVAAGETLYSLARRWGVEVAALESFNGLAKQAPLKVGQVLWVPPPPPVASDDWPVAAAPRAEGGKLKSVSFWLPGADFVSVSAGTVVFQGEYRGVGRVVLVEADDKTIYGYGNFDDSVVVFGQKVKKGQVLGKASSRPSERLVFFASRQGEPVDLSKSRRDGKS